MKKICTIVFSLITSASFAQLQNPGMENWTTYTADTATLERPNGWFGSDEAVFWADTGALGPLISPVKQIFQSGNFHSGTRAARIESHVISNFGSVAQSGVLSNAQMTYALIFSFSGGTPVTEAVPFVNAWVRYLPPTGGSDTGMMTVTAVVPASGGGDSTVGFGTANILPTSTYTNISCMITYPNPNVTPTRVQIAFYSSRNIVAGEEGTELWVDDVTISPVSIPETEKAKVVKLYPNPSSGLVSVYNTLSEPVTIKAFALNGVAVAEKTFTGNDVLDLTAQASGLYFFNVYNAEGKALQHGKLTVVK
jgi:hypothetical protein